MSGPSSCLLLRRRRAGDAVTNDTDAGAPAAALVVGRLWSVSAGVDEAAQRQRELAHRARKHEPFGLLRRQFERRGLADDDALVALLLDGLIDREDAYVR